MAIKVGDKIPSVTLHYLTPEGMKSVPSDEFFAGKKVAVFGLPGAYTRTCSSRHLPGYVTNAETLKQKGIDAVACVSVNDAFVMDAWGKEHHDAVIDDHRIALRADAHTGGAAINAETDRLGEFGAAVADDRAPMSSHRANTASPAPKRCWRSCSHESPAMERITLYGSFTSSSSYKPMLYLALARLPFSFRTVNLKYGRQKEPEYLAINRWGVVPSLRHRGLTILQSNVILDYLARETGHFEGATEQESWEAREWLSWEADHIMALAKVRHSARFKASHPEVIAEFRPKAEAALSFVDETLKARDWLVGKRCTIADIGCLGRMVFMAEGGFDIANWPHLEAWSRRLKAMPGFALPYDLIPSKDREFDPE